MPNPTDVSPIVVTGARPSGAANNVMAMWLMVDLALQEPAQVIIAVPAFGAVDGHEIVVQLGPGGTIKPEFAQAQIDALRDAFVRNGEIFANLDDTATYQFGPSTITGAELKASYFALKEIEVTDNIYKPGYGGENHGNKLYIGLTTSAGYGGYGEPGYNYLMIHEMAHNTVAGRAIVQQNFDRHLESGGTAASYDRDSTHFIDQERMTNSLVAEIAAQLGVIIDPPENRQISSLWLLSWVGVNPTTRKQLE